MQAARAFFNGKNSFQGATVLLVVTLTISNILGLFRDRLLAAKIPAGELDVYYAAFRLPDLLTNLIVIGAIAVVFIPVFTEVKAQSEEEGWRAASAILNMMLVLLLAAAAFLWLFMPQFMHLVVPDFTADKLARAVMLSRWLTLTPILFGMSYIFSGVLNSYHRFAVYSLAPLVYNMSIILATYLFADHYPAEHKAQVVIFGVLTGAVLHMLIQLPVAASLGWHWQPIFKVSHPAVKKVVRLMGPRIIGLVAMQLVAIVATAIASGWVGAIAYYTFANNIQTMPTAVFANSIATAIFPTITDAATRKNDNEFREHLSRGIRWVIFLLVPAAAGLILLRIQIVRLVLGAGLFGWTATKTTADVLGWFALSLVASGLVPLLARAFYARQNMQTPMTLALVSAVLTIGLSYLLPHILPPTIIIAGHLIFVGQVASLAIAFSIGMFMNAGTLLIMLRRAADIRYREVTKSLTKILLATLVMGILVQLSKVLIGHTVDLTHGRGILLQTLVPLVVGTASYLGVVAWLNCQEWKELKTVLKERLSSMTTSTKPA